MSTATAPMNRMARLWDSWLPVIFLGLSLSFSVYLVWLLHQSHEPKEIPETLTIGQAAPPLSASMLNGDKVTLDWSSDGRPTLVYIFREGCHWCARNMANLKALGGNPNAHYRFVALSVSDQALSSYVVNNKLLFPVYKNAHGPDNRSLAISGTPETYLISPQGIVSRRWIGAYQQSDQEEIERALGVRLPGLLEDSSSATPAKT